MRQKCNRVVESGFEQCTGMTIMAIFKSIFSDVTFVKCIWEDSSFTDPWSVAFNYIFRIALPSEAYRGIKRVCNVYLDQKWTVCSGLVCFLFSIHGSGGMGIMYFNLYSFSSWETSWAKLPSTLCDFLTWIWPVAAHFNISKHVVHRQVAPCQWEVTCFLTPHLVLNFCQETLHL